MQKYLLFIFILLFAISAEAQDTSSELEKQLSASSGKERVDLLNQSSENLENSEPLRARELAQEAINLSQQVEYPQGEAAALKTIGNIYLQQSNNSQALEYFLSALKIYEQAQDQPGIAETLHNIGTVYQNLRDFYRAKRFYQRVLRIDQKTNDRAGQASTLNNIGDLYYQQDEYNRAIAYYRESLKIRQEVNDREGIATSLRNLGVLYYTNGEYEKALEYFQKSLEIDEADGRQANVPATLNNIANSYLKQEKVNQALETALKALEEADILALIQEEAEISYTLADIYSILGDYEKAYFYQSEYVILEDEIYNQEKEEQIAELQNSYELDRVQREIDKKERQIDLLNKDREIWQLLTIIIIGGLLFLVITVAIQYRSNLQKRKANQLLRAQYLEIQHKNEEITAQSQAIELQNSQIEKQRDEIAHKNQNIQSSIMYALRIQQAMLPNQEKIDEALPLHFIYYRPRDIVSGDFYWFTKTDATPIFEEMADIRGRQRVLSGFENEKIVLAAVDCTGHGVPGAFMSMIGDSLLNQIINDKGIIHPDEILYEMNLGILKALHQAENNNKDGMDIALCVIDQEEKTIEFAGAKNSLLYMQDRKLREIKADIHSVGGWQLGDQAERQFSKHKISYAEEPITFYIYSDGYQDQFGGPDDRKFMRRRFKELLYDIHQEPMTYQEEILDKTFLEWKGEGSQMDDILVIGVRLE